jgi:hypothetical protein
MRLLRDQRQSFNDGWAELCRVQCHEWALAAAASRRVRAEEVVESLEQKLLAARSSDGGTLQRDTIDNVKAKATQPSTGLVGWPTEDPCGGGLSAEVGSSQVGPPIEAHEAKCGSASASMAVEGELASTCRSACTSMAVEGALAAGQRSASTSVTVEGELAAERGSEVTSMAPESALAAERGSAISSMAVGSALARAVSASTSLAVEDAPATARRTTERGSASASMAVDNELAAARQSAFIMAVESALAAERGSAFTSMAVESAKAAGRERESASTSTAGEGELAAEREGERGLAFTSMAVEGELAAERDGERGSAFTSRMLEGELATESETPAAFVQPGKCLLYPSRAGGLGESEYSSVHPRCELVEVSQDRAGDNPKDAFHFAVRQWLGRSLQPRELRWKARRVEGGWRAQLLACPGFEGPFEAEGTAEPTKAQAVRQLFLILLTLGEGDWLRLV